jgi:hypothetical protein
MTASGVAKNKMEYIKNLIYFSSIITQPQHYPQIQIPFIPVFSQNQSPNMKSSTVLSAAATFAVAYGQGSIEEWAPGGTDDCKLWHIEREYMQT